MGRSTLRLSTEVWRVASRMGGNTLASRFAELLVEERQKLQTEHHANVWHSPYGKAGSGSLA